jgi:hypothetical protein
MKIIRRKAPVGLAIALAGFIVMPVSASTIYSTIPTGLSSASDDFSNSVAFNERQISEFGALIEPVTAGPVTSATVALSNWGTAAQYSSANAGFNVNITLNLYQRGALVLPGTLDPFDNSPNGDATYAVGALIATSTTNATINWRPAADNVNGFACTDGQVSYSNAGHQQCGQINLVSFTFGSVALPTDLIWGVTFNSSTGGARSLNAGVEPFAPQDPLGIAVGLIGTNPEFTTAYVNQSGGGFAAQRGWGDFGEGAIFFDSATPEPATLGLIGFGLLGLGIAARKKNRR